MALYTYGPIKSWPYHSYGPACVDCSSVFAPSSFPSSCCTFCSHSARARRIWPWWNIVMAYLGIADGISIARVWAGTQNVRLAEAVTLSTGTPIPAQLICRRRCRYRACMQVEALGRASRLGRAAGFREHAQGDRSLPVSRVTRRSDAP